LDVTAADGTMIPFPTKYMSAGSLFVNEQGELLVVKPTYKDGWEIPGGIVEADESPKQACLREIGEELGLDVPLGPLLVVDYRPGDGERSDSLHFVFSGGTLRAAQIAAIRLPPAELSACRFTAPGEAPSLLGASLSRRIAACLRAAAEQRTLVLHDGHEV
jgi:8-oxo-dGTP pyrophosphatase MutT (NUDIX family)